MERESMEFDMVVVGAGPSGLATAIRFAQMAAEAGDEFTVCLVEKGSEIGAHILSGAVVETRALDDLIPDTDGLWSGASRCWRAFQNQSEPAMRTHPVHGLT